MVDDMKKKMRRFEHLIGFKGRLDVTARDSMKGLISALDSRYKSDVQSSLRLHRLEFFYDLVEGRRRRREKRDEIKDAPGEKVKKKRTNKDQEEDQEESTPAEDIGTTRVKSDEVLSIGAKDIDDWKDLMTLSKIYYVLEHPRSEGLTWKRRIAKKKNINKFGDNDLVEWRVTQHFRLRGFEEWAQSRSDARKVAEQECDNELLDSDLDEDSRELEELYEMLDPSGRKYKKSPGAEKRRRAQSTSERPFKFLDECIEDWTESYSEDSDYSGAEDFVEEIDQFPDEIERKLGEFDEATRTIPIEEESMAEIFSKYPEFLKYREEIFEQMDKAETLEEWYKLYHEISIAPEEPETDVERLDKIIEEEEEAETEEETDVETVQHEETAEELETEQEEAADELETGIREEVPDTEEAEQETAEEEPEKETTEQVEEREKDKDSVKQDLSEQETAKEMAEQEKDEEELEKETMEKEAENETDIGSEKQNLSEQETSKEDAELEKVEEEPEKETTEQEEENETDIGSEKQNLPEQETVKEDAELEKVEEELEKETTAQEEEKGTDVGSGKQDLLGQETVKEEPEQEKIEEKPENETTEPEEAKETDIESGKQGVPEQAAKEEENEPETESSEQDKDVTSSNKNETTSED